MQKRLRTYGVDDLVYDADVYDAQNAFEWDIPFYLKQAKRARGRVLELCCGTGRIAIPLAKAGIDITGVDMSRSMLGRAKEKAAKEGLQLPWIHADMRKLRLRKRFDLIFIPYNSLQNTYSLNDLEKVFAVVRSHLAEGGRFVFDIFNPSIQYMVKAAKLQKSKYKFRLPDRELVGIDECCLYDSAAQVNRVAWFFKIGHEKHAPVKLDMRCFYPLEMDALLKYNGFKVLKKFGTFDEKPFTSGSMKQIYICGKLASARKR